MNSILRSLENVRPADIERRSMEIIEGEIGDTSALTPEQKLIVKRVIHTTADFDFLNIIRFSENATDIGLNALKNNAVIVTDTQMALSGISKPALNSLGCEAVCFMSDPQIASIAKENGITRAAASMNYAADLYMERNVIFAIGNAPTALVSLYEIISECNFLPSLIIGAPVGFVNVVQSKQLIMNSGVPFIITQGRKGGSGVAAAICNALLYMLYDRTSGRLFE